MIKNTLNQQNVSFAHIRKTIIFGFFLAGFLVIFLTIGMVVFLNEAQNDSITKDLTSRQSFENLKHFLTLAMISFTLTLVGLYKFLAKPIMETLRVNFEELNRQAEQSTSILENTSDLIWAIDSDFKLLAFNSSFAKLMKYQGGNSPKIGDSILSKNYSMLSFSIKKKLYEKALAGESFETDFKLNGDDRTQYFELSFHPIYDKNKAVSGCSVFRKNITLRVEMYRELEKKEGFLKEAQEIANIGHWNWNMVTDEIQWSDQLYKVFGLDYQTFEANYEGLMNVIHPEDQEAFGVSVENCLTKKDLLDIVHRIVMPDGSIRYVHQKGKAYFLEDETPSRMAGTIQDVTQLEEARQQNIRQYNELQNFVYIISHNVRAPIATLQSLVDIIEPGNESLNAEILPSIETTVETLDRTIKDLNYSLALKNIQEKNFEEVDLRKVFRDIEHLLAIHIDASKATIEYNLSKAPKVKGIKSYFTNILFNLVMNSIDYKAEDRPLHIKITSQSNSQEGMEIIVADNGKGMDLNSEKRKRIFDMYGRLSGTSNGRGMGLYLAKTQVEVMNGAICVESEPNRGTTFKVVF
ncbi:hypothetical protein FEE95_09070 [Maribacter algarum]|uniref:histidine kinase n=1 Tax=Maribacter algarum (ex Zhang et al. 2020) TaxID=2578118 RepID=A0A5S3QGI3_9FLAO|nr:ATP-binding protein [Maribacter algarum]TMM56645.1 hypothetical protein FEE95_09070 [Maribacter algarum]